MTARILSIPGKRAVIDRAYNASTEDLTPNPRPCFRLRASAGVATV